MKMKDDIKRPSVSVCMATYNGMNHIENQINSILPQLYDSDELIISDDGSTDGTIEYITNLAEKDKRIKVIDGPHKGANCNFFSLINTADKDIIFLSDQDDVWALDKIEKVCDVFGSNNDIMVVLHRDTIVYLDDNREISCNKLRHGVLKNIIKSSYSGHRMALRKEFRTKIMKNTDLCPAYDMYLGLLAEKYKCSAFLNENLDKHIMHGRNVTRPLSIKNKVIIRLKLLACLFS